ELAYPILHFGGFLEFRVPCKCLKRIGSSGRTRTYNPSVNSRMLHRRMKPMATSFNRDDVRRCFRCDRNPPSYRLVSLERFLNESGELEPDCMAALFCDDCLKLEIDDNFGALAQNRLPVGTDESAKDFLSRQIGFLVVPLALEQKESELLV